MPLSHLEPMLVFKHFGAICGIPHPSGHEEKLAEHIQEFAVSKAFETARDGRGNLVIRVPATPGCETATTVVLQAHIDMVGEANADANHDFVKDPIRPYVDGDLVKARGTTLGADNGVGVAAGLAVSEDPTAVHGPLELLCTVDEEVGLTGAMSLEPDFLKGRILLNLDGEESGHAYIGCAGGGDSRIRLALKTRPPKEGLQALRVAVTGLRGGHSGCDIHEQRGNALRVLGRCLGEARKKTAFFLAEVAGGNKRNAIAREANAVAVLVSSRAPRFKKAVAREAEAIQTELAKVEPGLKVSVEDAPEAPAAVLDRATTEKLLRILLALPHGVERMSDEIPGLVETSCNLASIRTENGAAAIEMSTRSSVASALRAQRDRIAAAARLAGAEVEESDPYPGWKPNLSSKLAQLFKAVHAETLGAEPQLLAIHAGLETGVIGEKYPGMDMISFGPDIRHPHSPDEQLSISSVQSFYKLLLALLRRLAGK